VGSIELKWWEALLLMPLLLLGILFALAGNLPADIVLVAIVVVVVTWRATVVERNLAGGYARTRGALELARATALLAIYCIVVYFLFVARREHWSSGTRGSVAIWAMAGLSIYLVRDVYRLGEAADRWFLGSDTEREVAALLDPLREEGWIVTHDIKKDRGGNVDHFVNGPYGAYAIETKSGRGRAADRNQAIWNAVWAKEKFGLPWVTGVLCVGADPPPQPIKQGHAWILGVSQLVDFLHQAH
jgi:hypothetical protein